MAKRRTGSGKKGSKKEVLAVASKVKNYIRSKDMLCSADAVQTISDGIYACLDRAMQRAQANRRSTVKAQDL